MIDPIEKADALRQIADWYMEMDMETESIEYRRLSYQVHPQNYKNIKRLIKCELYLQNWEAAINITKVFFKMDPTNPRVMQDILSIYDLPNLNKAFENTICELENTFFEKDEALGNIRFHYGIFLMSKGLKKKGRKYLKMSRRSFNKIFKANHYVFRKITKALE